MSVYERNCYAADTTSDEESPEEIELFVAALNNVFE